MSGGTGCSLAPLLLFSLLSLLLIALFAPSASSGSPIAAARVKREAENDGAGGGEKDNSDNAPLAAPLPSAAPHEAAPKPTGKDTGDITTCPGRDLKATITSFKITPCSTKPCELEMNSTYTGNVILVANTTVDEMRLTMKARSFVWPFSMHGWIGIEVNEGSDVCAYDGPRDPCPVIAGEKTQFWASFTVPYSKHTPDELRVQVQMEIDGSKNEGEFDEFACINFDVIIVR